MDVPLASQDFEEAVKAIEEDYGVQADDDADDADDKNEKLKGFIEDIGDPNFYTCTTLLVLDPTKEFDSIRANLKMFLLPMFQILVPFGMSWYFLVDEQLLAKNGVCCNNADKIFRFTGFVTFMYSGWQIIDGCDDASAKTLVAKSVKMWSLTGHSEDLKAAVMFYLSYGSQQLCSFLLLVVTYVIYTSQCDTPLDLLMNCVAINFVLDVDSEWVDDSAKDKGKESAKWLFKHWRDRCIEEEEVVKTSQQRFQGLRKNIESLVTGRVGICNAGDFVILVSTYVLVFGWTFCPPQY
jgi:hypothetical protein